MMEEKNLQESTENDQIETTEEKLEFENSVNEKLKNLNTPSEETIRNVKELFREFEGQNINIVLADTIQDSSFFSDIKDTGEEKPEAEQEYCLTQEEDFLKFMDDKRNSCLKLYLLMLLGVRVIEINNLNHYTEQIKRCIRWNEEESTEDTDLPFSKVCRLLGVRQMGIQKRTQAGMMIQEAIGYTENDIRILRDLFWGNYMNLREPLIRWLAEVNEGKQYPGAVLAGMGLADFARIDFAFIYDRVVVSENKFYSEAQIYCMKRIMENAWKEERYRNNVKHLLHHWLDQDRSQSWLVSLVCYLSDANMVDKEKLKKCLEKKIEIFAIEQKWAGILILTAHQNPVLCSILYDAMAELYAKAESRTKKERICLQFLSMLFVENCYVSEKKGNLVLLKLMEDKECVRKQRPMMLLIWRNLEYRRLLQGILDRYFSNLPMEYDEVNLKNFFMMLAFTGQKSDFENMMVYLKRESGCGNMTIKKRLYRELQEVLIQRKKRLEVK